MAQAATTCNLSPEYQMSDLPFRRCILPLLLLFVVGTACRREPPAPPIGPADTAVDRLMVGVGEEGVYRLTLAELQAAGLDLPALDSEQMQLTQAGTAVPYLLQDDALFFYGRAADSRYTNTRPYLLQIGQPGELMAATAVSPSVTTTTTVSHTLRREENHLYEARALDADHADPWFWHKISQGQSVEIPLRLPAVADAPAQLRLQLWGQTHNPEVLNDHDLDVLINGQLIETIRWDGPTHHQAVITLPPGVLRQGDNQIILNNEAPGAVLLDIMLLNWLELELPILPTAVNDTLTFYTGEDTAQSRFGFVVTLTNFSAPPLVLNVQDPALPTRLPADFADGLATVHVAAGMAVTAVGPQGYRSPDSLALARQSDWLNRENQADLLIITTDALAAALTPLVEARQAQGLTAAVVPVAEIYDAFGGETSPESIQQFVAYAATNWQDPKPRYLLLVGDATTDYRGYNPANPLPANHVPSLLVPVAYSGETVSDGRLADVDGDGQPDLAVGRWPLDSVAEVESLVARTLAYEAGTAVSATLFATDASESQFAGMARRLWERAGIPETAVTLLNGASADEVTAVWNQGAWLTTYIGHGSLALWGKENLFNLEAVGKLQSEQPAIVVQLTCLTGFFAQPGVESLAEVMLQHQHGPVLTVAATSLTLSDHQEPFAAALLQNLADPTVLRMGDAFQQAKLSLNINDNGLREVSDTFALLGDPSALIVRPVVADNNE